jgi:hypothetical protein
MRPRVGQTGKIEGQSPAVTDPGRFHRQESVGAVT